MSWSVKENEKKRNFLPPSKENIQAVKNVFEQQLVRGQILRSPYVWLHFKLFKGLWRLGTSARVQIVPESVKWTVKWDHYNLVKPGVSRREQSCVGFAQSNPEMLWRVWETCITRRLRFDATSEGGLLTGELCLNINKHAGKVKCPGKPRRSLSCLTFVFQAKGKVFSINSQRGAAESNHKRRHGGMWLRAPGCALNYHRMWTQML